jgi:glycosyltransferase involved in cell wall biosynthesis
LEKNNKKNIKKDLGICDESLLLTYTGRFSLHKNITQLVDTFLQALKSNALKSNTHLLLAGNFDNVGFMFGDVYHHEGELFREFDKMFQKYPDKLKRNIHFLGNVNNNELKDYYLESDYFISFSTYHDEDYGMSVAEAGACGCKMILTDWAGYKSFNLNKYVELIPTSLTELGPSFDKNKAEVSLRNISVNSQRKIVSESFKVKNVETVTQEMTSFINEEERVFKGFTELFLKLARRSQNGKKIFYDEMNRQMNAEYMEVYESYATRN